MPRRLSTTLTCMALLWPRGSSKPKAGLRRERSGIEMIATSDLPLTGYNAYGSAEFLRAWATQPGFRLVK
ncbi:DUF6368 family protein [Nonomuraea sp. NPDC005983]|uniref:DUF6368 family protein n=1 Tax=Nonomuraea sp. NPDC005983 TaxID=3155595 RepID=UPI0033AF8B79